MIWGPSWVIACFTNTPDSFEEGALKAVNLGDDADTVGAIYGMLARTFYGIHSIRIEWKEKCYFKDLVQTIISEILRQSQIK